MGNEIVKCFAIFIIEIMSRLENIMKLKKVYATHISVRVHLDFF